MPPSLVLRGARTAPGAGPVDLPITGDRIGGDIAGSTEVVDAGGRLVLPGLWDAHVHFDQWTLAQAALDLSGATSAAHAVALVAARLAGDPAPVVVAHGFRDGLWPDTPTAAALDAIAPGRPVVAFSADLHSAWFNTAALQRFSLHPHPTGLLRETEFMPLMNEIQRVDPEVRDRLVDSAARAAAARGVVGVVDFEIADTLAAWRRRIGAGTRHLRVRCGIWPRWLDAAIAAGMRTGDVVPGTAGLATVGPLKVIVDGSLGTRTAYCHDPYPDGGHGVLSVPPERLEPLMRHAHEHGVESAIHAIGDHACEHVLDAFAATGARGSVEHAQFVAERDFPRFARSGVTASIQPAHVYDDVDLAERYWPGRTHRAFPYGTLHAAGARLVLGSDAPVAPLDPWRTLAAAIDRTLPDGRVWHREHELDLQVALAASTGGRARVAVGDVADLVVLDADTLPRSGAELAAMPVWGTMLGGRWTHGPLA
ncbi:MULTISPECIES: amidohydrolase [unclassified Rhodococcus (in: high G+C Gram-positive bacteria)]|uniref:amidohydrolase n=1 Tax=unclassified Rhodococcus (in: high G+C Gram-positive bacteria) TaxID=192944 RepID=UPI00092A432B|nr:amidohydrolase family protein [Rhodococcus sp. M8]OLL17590.1 amidohydrolase [Rhodococcus sp. M8]QPG45863.1 amidohydrolase family protein [Rhodococcus sp. M8]